MSYLNVVSGIVIMGLVVISARGAFAQNTSGASGSPPSTGSMVVGGILGGVAGLALGIAAGNSVDQGILHHTQPPRWGAAAGAGIGTTMGIALGVHAFNNGRGRFLPVLGRTAATIAGFWAASYAAKPYRRWGCGRPHGPGRRWCRHLHGAALGTVHDDGSCGLGITEDAVNHGKRPHSRRARSWI